MYQVSKMLFGTIILIFNSTYLMAQSTKLWSESGPLAKPAINANLRVKVNQARYLHIDQQQLEQQFFNIDQSKILELPLPDGTTIEVELTPSNVLSPALAKKYPQLMTYTGTQVEKPQNTGRFSISQLGFFGFFRYQNEWMLLSPQYHQQTSDYVSYWYKDGLVDKSNLQSETVLIPPTDPLLNVLAKPVPTGGSIRTYKLAVSTTAEYTRAVGGTGVNAIDNVVAELMTLTNRINQILLNDLAVQFELVDNQSIIFTDPDNDPFSNVNAGDDITANQVLLDQVIGTQNYDIGHVLGTDAGGLASVGVVCNNSFKAQGYTGLNRPQGERFYIDLVAHEFGHQLGALHTFNAENSASCDDATDNSRYEPGSGSTIMSYSGICGVQNLQNTSGPYFHAISIEEIRAFVDARGRRCGISQTITPQNAIPQIQLDNLSFTIPANTPFVLDAIAIDADNDPLMYGWEQFNDNGAAGSTQSRAELTSDNGNNPLFRSFPPVDSGQRYFPKLSDVLANTISLGEVYATTDRDLRFRLTVRDGKGGVNSEDVDVTVINNGQTMSVNQLEPLWRGFSQQTVTWDVAETDLAPISCASVDILLAPVAGGPFSSVLATQVDNDGQHIVSAPNLDSNAARLMVKCSNNIFFAVNEDDFSVEKSPPISPVITGQTTITMAEDSSQEILLTQLVVADLDSVFPDVFSLTIEAGSNYTVSEQTITSAVNYNGLLNMNVKVNDGEFDSPVFELQVNVVAVNDPPIAINDVASTLQNTSLTINPLSNDSDIENQGLSISTIEYTGLGQASVINNQITYQSAANFVGSETITYVVTDGTDSVEATITIQVTASPVTAPPVVTPPVTSVPVTSESNGSGGGAIANLIPWMLFLLCYKNITAKRQSYE